MLNDRSVELLTFRPESPRTSEMFDALVKAAPHSKIHITRTTEYVGASDWLMFWGPGGPDRFPSMRAQLALGRHVIAWDLAYFAREMKLRVSIDAAHPQAWVMRWAWPADRWRAVGVPVSDAWDPNGPILVAGLGAKARVQYGASVVDAWEAGKVAECRARWDRPVLYRAKRGDVSIPPGANAAPVKPIDQAVAGCSLVITWHSNVAVDAIRMGIPVVCRDGAAASVCPSEVTGDHQPLSPTLRATFLQNLSYFEWAPAEASECWRFLSQVLA